MTSGKKRDSQETAIAKAKEKHDDLYDYSKTVYIEANEKFIVTCRIHGDFEVLASNHLRGHKCRKCESSRNRLISGEVIRQRHSELFIPKSKIIHNNFYSYEKVDYYNGETAVIITCPIHGYFHNNQ